jgi:phosphoglycerol geranylgeranyltransferase
MKVYPYLKDIVAKKGAGYLVLVDPDKIEGEKLAEFAEICRDADVDAFLIGGSLLTKGDLNETIETIKSRTNIPTIIFPGGVEQLSSLADAVLYISLISGRNAEQIFGKHVLAAPIIKQMGIEPISCGYMLIESGKITTAEYISGSKPIPRDKPEIALSTALAAEYIGMKSVYLEAGSGAENSVPAEMIKIVSSQVNIPVIVGGGITTAEEAREKVENGASFIVTGNYFEEPRNWGKIKNFAEAVHFKNN